MKLKGTIIALTAMALALSPMVASAAMTATCTGTPSATSITWTATSTGGVAPVAFLWGNGNISATQTVAVAPGIYSMTLQATDASSTVATTTCSATVAQPVPSITSFMGTPASITAGQSSVLSWIVANASSTMIDGIGTVTSPITVTPTVTTTYHLSAVNPMGTTSANTTVTVGATTTPPTGLAAQITAILAQIAALKAQLAGLVVGGIASSTPNGTPAPAACFNFARDLKKGDKGEDVKNLQAFLAQNQFLIGSSSVTGFFGPLTEQALIKYQGKYGIFSTNNTLSGFFGPKTQKFFMNHCLGGKDTGDNDQGTTTPLNIGNQGDNGNHGKGNNGKGNDN